MTLKLELIPHLLQFKFDARTSRGAMQQHQVYYLKLFNPKEKQIFGLGECAPLPGLSQELHPDYDMRLQAIVDDINIQIKNEKIKTLESIIYNESLKAFPAVVFALETAWLDYKAGGKRKIYNNNFSRSESGIPINGLIWMGDKDFMQTQIKAKLKEGYSCLKLKIGGLDLETELSILAAIRAVAPASDLTIRLDANGAFLPSAALNKLKKLSVYHIHSIEQPIRAGQWEAMEQLIRNSPIPIALDEELIGLEGVERKTELLDFIKPSYIILKPTLLGGLAATANWIELAEERGIKWWITSALESNIGLNAISQFTAEYFLAREQGLGTGQLYHNNIPSPLIIQKGKLYYGKDTSWNLSLFN